MLVDVFEEQDRRTYSKATICPSNQVASHEESFAARIFKRGLLFTYQTEMKELSDREFLRRWAALYKDELEHIFAIVGDRCLQKSNSAVFVTALLEAA
jgi:hypothetical protein